MAHKKNKSSYSMPVRIITIALTVLVASGALVYLLMMILNLFGVGSGDVHVH